MVWYTTRLRAIACVALIYASRRPRTTYAVGSAENTAVRARTLHARIRYGRDDYYRFQFLFLSRAAAIIRREFEHVLVRCVSFDRFNEITFPQFVPRTDNVRFRQRNESIYEVEGETSGRRGKGGFCTTVASAIRNAVSGSECCMVDRIVVERMTMVE